MLESAELALVFVYCSEALLVIEKPSGLPAVPGRGTGLQDCVASRAQEEFADALVVHRLDMATSGLMLMARGAEAQRSLSAAFAARDIEKRYVARVDGRVPMAAVGGWAEIALPIGADWPERPRQKVDPERGKPSLTRYRVLDHRPCAHAPSTRVELQPLTGRTHQLRVHLMAIGRPIVGDTLYAPAQVQARSPRLLLHASALTCTDPTSGHRLAFTSAAPF
jgi:tRNA pseudouridine32 synthase / 23S rRNA pseudouridine746 synthase